MNKLESKNEFYFQWHFLEKCNLRCIHCYQEDYQPIQYQWDFLKKIANQILNALIKWNKIGRISLTGGEPFLSSHLNDLLHYLSSSSYVGRIDILSNGTCILPEHIIMLQQVEKLRQVQISLDGASSEIHDLIRGEGTFDKVITTIRQLRASGLEVALMFTLMRENMNEVPELVDLAVRERVNALTIERVTPCGNAAGIKTSLLSAFEVKEIYEFISRRALDDDVKQSGLSIRRSRPLWINTVNGDYSLAENKKVGGFCPVGLTALAILADGTVLPCRRLNIPLGNILTDGLFKIWYTSEVLWDIRNKNNLKGKCRNCENMGYCGGCRAIAYELTGDYLEEDGQCWKE